MNDKVTCIELYTQIIESIDNLPSGPFWMRDLREGKYRFPAWLSVGNGEQIHITPEINRMLMRFSKFLMTVFYQAQQSEFTDSEWNLLVKREFGLCFRKYFLDKGAGAEPETFIEDLRRRISKHIRETRLREYVFGCHFCSNPKLAPLSIGPVRFEPKLKWLARFHRADGISDVARARIERAWDGKRLRPRKPSDDESTERQILKTTNNCDFVCTVEVGRVGEEAARQKALIAARLATTAVSLAWVEPTWALRYLTLTYDRQPHHRENLVTFSGTTVGWYSSSSFLPGGITSLDVAQWETLRSDFAEIHACAGEAIRYLTHGKQAVSRPNVMETLFQSLLWFHEACRDELDAMAIVKYCSAMEALACGGKEKRIVKLAKARLHIRDETQFVKDVRRLYRKGRSRTVHGTNDRLGHDWSHSRGLAERIARACLISCLELAADPFDSDDPQIFLQPTSKP